MQANKVRHSCLTLRVPVHVEVEEGEPRLVPHTQLLVEHLQTAGLSRDRHLLQGKRREQEVDTCRKHTINIAMAIHVQDFSMYSAVTRVDTNRDPCPIHSPIWQLTNWPYFTLPACT